MAIGRYFQPTPYEGQLYTPPVDVIAGALEKAQKQYDTNFLLTESLRNKYVEALPQDRAKANERQKQFESQIDATVAKYNGDYGAATADLYKLTSDMRKAFSPGGEMHAIQQRYTTVAESMKAERERLAKGDVTSDMVNLLQNYYYSQPAIEKDPETGAYTPITPVALAKYVNEHELAQKAYDSIPIRKKKVDVYKGIGPTGDYMYETEEVEWKDTNEVVAAIDATLFSSDQYQGYVRQMAELSGQDPEQLVQKSRDIFLSNYLPSRTGVISQSFTVKFEDNWRARKAMDLRNDLIMEREKLKNRIMLEGIKNNTEAMGDRKPTVLAVARGVSDNLPDLPETYSTKDEISTNPVLKFLAGPRPSKALDVDKLLKDIESGKPITFQVNPKLLKTIRAANPDLPSKDIIRLYNQQKNQVHTEGEVLMDAYKTTAAQREEAARLLPLITSGKFRVLRIDPDTGTIEEVTEADERIALANAYAKAAKDKSPNFAALGKSRTANGNTWFGTVMPDPTGGRAFYVFKEQRADIERLQTNVLDKAFGWIQDPTRINGDPFPVERNGRESLVIGVRNYLDDGSSSIYYYDAVRGSDGKYRANTWDPKALWTNTNSYGQTYPIGQTEMESILLDNPTVYSTYPRATQPKYENEIADY